MHTHMHARETCGPVRSCKCTYRRGQRGKGQTNSTRSSKRCLRVKRRTFSQGWELSFGCRSGVHRRGQKTLDLQSAPLVHSAFRRISFPSATLLCSTLCGFLPRGHTVTNGKHSLLHKVRQEKGGVALWVTFLGSNTPDRTCRTGALAFCSVCATQFAPPPSLQRPTQKRIGGERSRRRRVFHDSQNAGRARTYASAVWLVLVWVCR